MIFGLAEDYHKTIVNAKHELILTRSKSDSNAILQAAPIEQYKIEINKIEWFLPSVRLSDSRKFQLLKYIEKDPPILVNFRSWELYEYPLSSTSDNLEPCLDCKNINTVGEAEICYTRFLNKPKK